MAKILNTIGTTLYEVSLLPGTAPRGRAPNSKNPDAYDMKTDLGRGLALPFPFMSANMEKVTGKEMLGALALHGGLPILHQFAPIKERIAMIRDLMERDIDRKLYPNASLDKKGKLILGAAIGYDQAVVSAKQLIEAGVQVIVFDSANAYTPGFIGQLKHITALCDSIQRARDEKGGDRVVILAGNVATPQGAQMLFKAGVDGVKVGIGTGTGCDTGPQTGIYIPQLTAIQWISEVADAHKGLLIADGGVKKPRDAVIALAFAHLVMMGSVFAGTDESPGETIIASDRKKYVGYAGSASTEQRQARASRYPDHYMGQRSYEHSEGLSGFVRYRGSVKSVLTDFANVLRIAMWYVGVNTIADFRAAATLLPLSASALKELEKADIYRWEEGE